MKVVKLLLIFIVLSGLKGTYASAQDNAITSEYIQKIHLQDPDRALHLLDSAEQHRLSSIQPYEIDMLRAMCYEVAGEYVLKEKYTRRALASDSVQLVPSRKIRMLTALIGALVEQGKNEEAIRYGREAMDLARSLDNPGREGDTFLSIGKVYRNMNRVDEALDLYRQGIEVMKESADVRVMASLSTAYGETMALLMENNRLEEAVEFGKERETIIKRMSGMPGPPPSYIDQQYGFHYSKMAYLLMLAGQEQEAETYYREFMQTDFSKSPAHAGEIIPYLLEARRYADALKLNKADMVNFQEAYGNDTVNYVYWIIMDRFAQAYRGLRLYKEADACQLRLTVLYDSIYSREQASRAHQYAVAFNLHEKDLQLAESRIQSQKRGFWLIGSCVVVLLLCVLVGVAYRNWRITLRRNKIAAKQIDELLAQREEARNACCQDSERFPMTHTDVYKTSNESENKISDTPNEQDKDAMEHERFLHMEYILVKDRLFLQPNFGRDDLMNLGNINKNDLPRILRKYANADNVSTYLNRLRVEYAVKQMKSKPFLSFDAIAKEASFNSHSTFYRAFYKVYGMTPSQYMKAYREED